MLKNKSRKRWSHFRTQTQSSSAFVLKTEELLADFVSCLADIKIFMFQHTSIIFFKTRLYRKRCATLQITSCAVAFLPGRNHAYPLQAVNQSCLVFFYALYTKTGNKLLNPVQLLNANSGIFLKSSHAKGIAERLRKR